MLIGVLAGVLGGALLAEVWLAVLLRRAGVWARPVGVGALDAVGSAEATLDVDVRERVIRALGASHEGGAALCLAGLRWLVEQCPADGKADDEHAAGDARFDPVLFPQTHRPHCGEIAAVYRGVLAALGVESRTVWLRKNVFDPHDSHVSVEARIDGRWVLIDPTFHATFVDAEGQLLGAQEVKAYLFKGQRAAVTPVVHGRALCPLALDDYYVDVLACFNNVFILDDPTRPALLKLPPMRYVLGPRLYYEKLADESVAHLRVWRRLYCAAAFGLPCVILGITLAMVVAVAV
ncbi:transglutaminase domain-containing protein [Phycisphaeraceae bacterium D3-23]